MSQTKHILWATLQCAYFVVRALDINVSTSEILAFLTFRHSQVLLHIDISVKNLESTRYILQK
jgi:hypothetical protein